MRWEQQALLLKQCKEMFPRSSSQQFFSLSAAGMALASGTSWGTFAIMLPIAIPMAVALDAHLLVCIGAVLSGGIFGDHCSPISDTTILSSTGAGADHIDHVKTQFPYALLNASIAFVGFIVAGITGSAVTLLLTVVLLILAVICIIETECKKIQKRSGRINETLGRTFYKSCR